uniref:Uncharacterized protein n=1 Tax=Arundo donax TaxID=35708 RepID=A0A0A9HZ18_ARUDO
MVKYNVLETYKSWSLPIYYFEDFPSILPTQAPNLVSSSSLACSSTAVSPTWLPRRPWSMMDN